MPRDDYGDSMMQDMAGGRGGGQDPYRGGTGRDPRAPSRDFGRGGYSERAYDDSGVYDDSGYGPPVRDDQRGGGYGGRGDDWDESEQLPAWRGGDPRGGGRKAADWGEDSEGRFHIPADDPGGKSGKRSTRRVVGIVVAIVLAILVIVPLVIFAPQAIARFQGGGDAVVPTPLPFATYTPGPSPTVAPHFKLYTSQGSGYAMSYPELWTPPAAGSSGTSGDHIDTFQGAGSSARLSIERSGTFDSHTDAEISDGEVQGAQKTGATFTAITDAPNTQNIGGESWLRHEYSVAYDNQTLHMVILVCHHLGHGYAMVLTSSEKDYPTATSTYFTPMLQSFRFT